jgi:tetratricopeptide (TPR) repeat protein
MRLSGLGQFREASLAFRKAIQLDGRFGEAHYQLALSELKPGGDPRRALEALRQASVLLPTREDPKLKLAEFYMRVYLDWGATAQFPLREAKEIAKVLISRNAESYEALRLNGQIALIEGDRAEATRYFRLANKARPGQADTLFLLADALPDSSAAEAEALLREAIQHDRSFVPAYRSLYAIYMNGKRTGAAEALLRSRLANLPTDPGGPLALAEHYFRIDSPGQIAKALSLLTSDPKTFPQAWLQAGDFCRSTGRIAEARSFYEQGLRRNGADGIEYQKRLASLLLLEGKREDAVKLYEQVVKEAPKDEESLGNRASLLLEKDAGAAVKEFQELVKSNPNSPVLHYNLGLAYLAKRELDKARTSFLEANRRQRTFLPSRSALAQLSLDAARYREVQQYANEILALNSKNPEARYYLCAALTGLERFADARQELNSLLKEFPQYPEPRLQMALLNLAEGKLGEAEDGLRRMYSGTGDVRALTGIVEVYLAGDQKQKALQVVLDELNRRPSSPRIRLLYAQTALRTGRYQVAADQFLKLVEDDPEWDFLYLRLGEAFQLNGDVARAVVAFGKAVELAPHNIEAILRLAYAYEVSGQLPQAIAVYRRALSVNPRVPIAMNNLAFLLAETGGSLDEALRLAQEALRLVPQNRHIADTVGWIFLKQNATDSALQIFDRLVRKYPKEALFRYHLGAALLAKGDSARAKTQLQAALDLKPTEEQEKKIRQLLSPLALKRDKPPSAKELEAYPTGASA